MKADYVVSLCRMRRGQKAALKRTIKSTASGQLAVRERQ